MSKIYTIVRNHYLLRGDTRTYKETGTLAELVKAYSYTLECGASFSHERGNYKVSTNPKSIKSLVSNLNKAAHNRCRYYQSDYYELEV